MPTTIPNQVTSLASIVNYFATVVSVLEVNDVRHIWLYKKVTLWPERLDRASVSMKAALPMVKAYTRSTNPMAVVNVVPKEKPNMSIPAVPAGAGEVEYNRK